MDQNFDHQMSLSKSKCLYSNKCLHFLKRHAPLKMRKNITLLTQGLVFCRSGKCHEQEGRGTVFSKSPANKRKIVIGAQKSDLDPYRFFFTFCTSLYTHFCPYPTIHRCRYYSFRLSTHTHTHTHIHTPTYTHTHTHIYIYIFIYKIYTCISMYKYTHIHSYIHTNSQSQKHTYVHTYIHT